jgi:hypothetical protein
LVVSRLKPLAYDFKKGITDHIQSIKKNHH